MNIYEPLGKEGYEIINAHDNSDYESFLSLNGTPCASTWHPIKVHRVRADNKQACRPSDFPWLGADTLVMRKKAVDALCNILKENGEILPLETDDEVDLSVLNAQVVDALDEINSDIIRFPSSNRIMLVKKPAFIKEKIEGIDIFRLPHRASSTYVSDVFVNRVKDAGLEGITFKKVWSSD